MLVRKANGQDLDQIAEIYNQGIAGRGATFETEPRSPGDIAGWLDEDQLGFRQVGVYEKHGQLDGEWRDCVIVEILLIDAA